MIGINKKYFRNIFRTIFWLPVTIVMICMAAIVYANVRLENLGPAIGPLSLRAAKEFEIEPGIYILVSFSMKDEPLRAYFKEAKACGATLVMRGLVTNNTNNNYNRFANTKARTEKARINIDINPNLFEQLSVEQVPVIAYVDESGNIKKISGHITLEKALEYMDVKGKMKQTSQTITNQEVMK